MLHPAQIIQALCPKNVVSSAIGTYYLQPMRDSKGQQQQPYYFGSHLDSSPD